LCARQKSARLKNLTVSSHVGRLLAAPTNVRLRWMKQKGTTPLAYQKMELASNVKTFLHKNVPDIKYLPQTNYLAYFSVASAMTKKVK
jgi:hypothetical protein